MGQLMGIVGPLLLLGGAIFVVSKRCELLGMCGDTGGDSGIVPEAAAEEVPTTTESADTSPAGASGTTDVKRTGCCTCGMQGDRVKCHRGDGVWFNPPAGSGGSNDQSVELSLAECNKGCGSSSTSGSKSASTGARAGVRSGASIPKKPRLSASGNVGSGAGAGGNRSTSRPRTSSSNTGKRPTMARPGGAVVKTGVSFYGYRSYFVDPYYIRPFTLYHRIAN